MRTTFLICIFLVRALYCAAAELDPVYESSHTKLLTGVKYYILPFAGGSSDGGITVAASSRNKTCPLHVAQESKASKKGLAVTFHPVNIKKGASSRVIRVSTDLIIKFSTAKACAPSPIWKVEKYDNSYRRNFVTIGGVQGKQGGGESLRGSFRIEKEGRYYKIVYCTQVHCITKPCDPVCNNVGVYIQRGPTLLTLAQEPLVVFFQEAFKG